MAGQQVSGCRLLIGVLQAANGLRRADGCDASSRTNSSVFAAGQPIRCTAAAGCVPSALGATGPFAGPSEDVEGQTGCAISQFPAWPLRQPSGQSDASEGNLAGSSNANAMSTFFGESDDRVRADHDAQGEPTTTERQTNGGADVQQDETVSRKADKPMRHLGIYPGSLSTWRHLLTAMVMSLSIAVCGIRRRGRGEHDDNSEDSVNWGSSQSGSADEKEAPSRPQKSGGTPPPAREPDELGPPSPFEWAE